MKLKNLQNKKIALLGLGVENYAMLKFLLKKKIKAEFTICDQRDGEQLRDRVKEFTKNKNISWKFGDDYNKSLFEFDILFRSPGWPISCPGIVETQNLASLRKGNNGIVLTSPMNLFFGLCPTKNVIGVTGTKGKGTTSTLIYSILKAAKKRVWLGGNIGIAPFEFLPKIKKSDWVVLELSSFQLEDATVSPHISVITNFYKEHLAPADPNNPNYHKSLKTYLEAKLNIIRYQKKSDFVVINKNLESKINSKFQIPNSKQNINSKLKISKIIYFDKSDLPSKLLGEHNKENIAAAVAVAKIVKIKDDVIMKAVAKFQGLEHRLEFVKEVGGVKYYNDSFATTPESSITALKSFSEPIVLLAGGADKGADFKQFAKEIKKRVKFLVLLDGKATSRLQEELVKIGFLEEKMQTVSSIKDAVALAKRKTEPGDVTLLSTACASFGMFKNYKERGRLFKEEVGI